MIVFFSFFGAIVAGALLGFPGWLTIVCAFGAFFLGAIIDTLVHGDRLTGGGGDGGSCGGGCGCGGE
ncbi:hypothetical protein [Spirillospora sp. NPDC029432]|uniref:hypothetical protein n=1 Tax=Spirillospora sp. NPDC029432 TaxID=3154599 RepID=UPI0034556C9F